jgi:hypothetical protein
MVLLCGGSRHRATVASGRNPFFAS